VTAEETERNFRLFARSEVNELPTYVRVVNAAADDPGVMDLMEAAPRGQRRPNLLLAAVHDLLLAGATDQLGRWYQTVNGGVAPPAEDPGPAFLAFIDDHRDEIVDALEHRATQTNEPNRSCLWWIAIRAAAADVPDRPLSLVELGPSAGLNLAFDRATYDWGAHDPPDARLRCAVRRGAELIDAPSPPIVGRTGIDQLPISLDDEAGLRWLKACIWPEQPERHLRFDAAVARSRLDPPQLVAGDLIEQLPAVIAAIPRDHHMIVVNTWVLAYVRRDRRVELSTLLDELAAGRTMSWITAEGPTVVDWVDDERDDEFSTVVGLARWRNGVRTNATVARCHAHLAWLDWFG
jgi:hypothetical protein